MGQHIKAILESFGQKFKGEKMEEKEDILKFAKDLNRTLWNRKNELVELKVRYSNKNGHDKVRKALDEQWIAMNKAWSLNDDVICMLDCDFRPGPEHVEESAQDQINSAHEAVLQSLESAFKAHQIRLKAHDERLEELESWL